MSEMVTYTISSDTARQAIKEMLWLRWIVLEPETSIPELQKLKRIKLADTVIKRFSTALKEQGEIINLNVGYSGSVQFINELNRLGQGKLAHLFTVVYKHVKTETKADPANKTRAEEAMKEMDIQAKRNVKKQRVW